MCRRKLVAERCNIGEVNRIRTPSMVVGGGLCSLMLGEIPFLDLILI